MPRRLLRCPAGSPAATPMAGRDTAAVRPQVAPVPFPGEHGGRLVRWLKRPRAIVQAGSVLAYCVVFRPPPRVAKSPAAPPAAQGTAPPVPTDGSQAGSGGGTATPAAESSVPSQPHAAATNGGNAQCSPSASAGGAAVPAPAPAPAPAPTRAPGSTGRRVPLRAPVAGRVVELLVKVCCGLHCDLSACLRCGY